LLVPGDNVNSDTVIVVDPKILLYKVDDAPIIQTSNLIVGTNHDRWIHDQSRSSDVEKARKNLREIFGAEGVWTDQFPI